MATTSKNSPSGAPAPPAEAAPTAEALAEHLRSAVSVLIRATRTADRLAPIPAAVLDLLDVRGPMTTADLAASRGVRHQTMAATVKDLADAGYLTADPDPTDARKKILTLTPSGKGMLEADRRQRAAVLAAAINQTLDGDADHRTLANALHLIDRIAEAVRTR